MKNASIETTINWEQDLNPQQLKAVFHRGSPLLVLAGAGSGKTRVITYRIVSLLEEGVNPRTIMAVTFTNKAAREMRERIQQMVDAAAARNLWVMTFHASCARILRHDAQYLGLSSNFTIYDDKEQQNIIKACMEQLGVSTTKNKPKDFQLVISRAKQNLLDPEAFAAEIEQQPIAARTKSFFTSSPDCTGQNQMRVYDAYQAQLKKMQGVDFEDLLRLTVSLLEQHESVRLKWQERFEHVMIDEYQDTNHAQLLITEMLAAPQNNLCVVGDDDQCIYTWRGAKPHNILDFRKNYRGAQEIWLEQNYRSTEPILEAANMLIANNYQRKKKKLWTTQQSVDKVRVISTANADSEAMEIAALMQHEHQSGVAWYEMAVFYRTNAQSRLIEQACQRCNIPYLIVGGFGFYQRKEVQDLLGYLRLLVNPNDNPAFLRIINCPRRGIGQTTIEALTEQAHQRELSLYAMALQVAQMSKSSQRVVTLLKSFTSLIEHCRKVLEEQGAAAALKELLRLIRYEDWLKKEDKQNYETRMENVGELITAISEHEKKLAENMQQDEALPDQPDYVTNLREFLLFVALTQNEEVNKHERGVHLMTLHAAKGLEFDVVFVSGMEETLLPIGQSRNSTTELEEERRLAYVGMTRARRRLYLTWASSRMLWGNTKTQLISRFIKEISGLDLECVAAGYNPLGSSGSPNKDTRSEYWRNERTEQQSSVAPSYSHKQQPLSNTRTIDRFYVGARVRHYTFGQGEVIHVQGTGDTAKVKVLFDQVGEKTLMLKIAKLENINE